MSRPRTVYRGKRKYGWIITLVVLLLAVALVAAAWLFYYLQKFIVYDKDGLKLVLPYMQTGDTPTPSDQGSPQATPIPGLNVDIVVDEKDYSDVVTGAGEGLDYLRARRLDSSTLSAAAITLAANDMGGEEALVIALKGPDGMLSYKSALKIADSYAVNGVEDISGAISTAKDRGIYLVAELSALEDSAMALRYAPAAMKNSLSGAVLDVGGQSWMDPYNSVTRNYLCDLMTELAGMGFDEVLFTGLTLPAVDNAAFSQPMSGSPGAVGSIASLSLDLRERADELGIKLSVQADVLRLRSGTGADIGQDVELFFRIFDRVVVPTDSYNAENDISLLSDALKSEDAKRSVPRLSGEATDWNSHILG